MIDVDALTSCRAPLFDGLGAADLAGLAAVLERVCFVDGDLIVRQGDQGRDLYIVAAGHVRLVRNELDLGMLSRGAHFGEISLVAERRRAATVRAVGDVVALRLTHDAWKKIVEATPGTAVGVLHRLADRLADQLVAMTDSVELLFDRPGVDRSATHTIELTVENGSRSLQVGAGTRLEELLPDVDGPPVVAAMLGQRLVSLATPILAPGRITAITLASWDGREVWRQSASLLFLAAARRAAPASRFVLAHSVGAGRIVRGPNDDDTRMGIEQEMRRLANAATPYTREEWTLEEARAHFAGSGDDEAVAALATARGPTVIVVGLAGRYAFAMGPLLPSTALLVDVKLSNHVDGFLLEHGATIRPWLAPLGDDVVAREIAHPRFVSPMAKDHQRWLRSMGVDSVGTFNASCVSGRVRELIRSAEGFHEKHIGRIADTIAARGDAVRVIAIAGPSSSGKTTFIKRLTVQLEVNGVRPVALSLDDYYVDRARCPRDENGDYDFEVIDALDTALLQRHLAALLAGESVATAHFDFKSGSSHPSGGPVVKLNPGEVLLIEGIHGLNPALVGNAVVATQLFRIFVQPALCLPVDALTSVMPSDLRFIRRIVRDRHGRGTNAADNILRWGSVRRGEGRHIFPHQHHADVMFDTSLAYEMSVLKVYGERYLLEVPADSPASATAFRLRSLLDRFVAIYPDHVPPTSILREFIGGSGFEY